MKLSIRYICFCLLILFSTISVGQNPRIDSLLSVLKTVQHDTIKVNTLNRLFSEFEYVDAIKAKQFLDEAQKLAQGCGYKKGLAKTYLNFGYLSEDRGDFEEAIKYNFYALKVEEEINDKKGIADAYNNIATVNAQMGNFPEALKYFTKSLDLRKQLGNKKHISDSYNNMGLVLAHLGNYAEALKNYFACLKVQEEIGNQKGISASYNNIAMVYARQNNLNEALKNNFASLEISKKLGHKKGIATSYNNIGLTYLALSEKENDRGARMKKLEEAMVNHLACLDIAKEIGDKPLIGNSNNNIGIICFHQGKASQLESLSENKFKEALNYHMYALKIMEEISDKSGIASSSLNIGDVYILQKQYIKAREYILKAQDILKTVRYKEYLKNSYRSLTKLDSIEGNFKGAYENHKMYILYRDSLDNEETRKKTIQSQMTYDFEKKEAVANAEHKKELEKQELFADEKSRKQKVIIAFVVCGLLLVIIFAGFIFRSLRITRKQKDIIEEQKSIVETQKQEVEQQKQIVEEHQKAIIDSITYARRIQRSLLPTEKYIERNLNRLNKN